MVKHLSSHNKFFDIMERAIRKRLKKVIKGVWRMPRLSQATKDVISCDKLRGSANDY